MKKLIIVGNKVIDKDISKEVESFDMIVRLNRMNNWGNTGTRTDLLLVDPHKPFFKLITKPYDKYNNAKHILLNTSHLWGVSRLLTENILSFSQLRNASRINIDVFMKSLLNRFVKDEQYGVMFSNFFVLVNFLIEKYSSEYEMWITGIDINGRGEMFKTNDIWSKCHSKAGFYEEEILQQFINDGILKFLPC